MNEDDNEEPSLTLVHCARLNTAGGTIDDSKLKWYEKTNKIMSVAGKQYLCLVQIS